MSEKRIKELLDDFYRCPSPAILDELCNLSVLSAGRLLPIAQAFRTIDSSVAWTVKRFRDATDQFLQLYGSPGEVELTLQIIKSECIECFDAIIQSFGEAECFDRPVPKPEAGQIDVLVPAWDGESISISSRTILQRRWPFIETVKRHS